MLEIILILLAIVLIVAIVMYLLKLSIKIGIVLVVAYFIFHMSFLWDYDTMHTKVPIIEEYLLPEYGESFRVWWHELTEKRYEYAMLDIDKMETDIDVGINNAIDYSKNKYEEIDKKKLITSLYVELKKFEENGTFQEFEQEVVAFSHELQAGGISEEETMLILQQLEDISEQINQQDVKIDDIEKELRNLN